MVTSTTVTGVQQRGLSWLAGDAADRRAAGLHRELRARAAGDRLLNLASNDYLGLSTHPDVVAAAGVAAADFGGGAGASRLVSGTTGLHAALEAELADFFGTEAALVFSSGYLGNVGVIGALAGRGDLIVSDAGSHASLIDGCRLSRAEVVVVDRGDVQAVRDALASHPARRALVVTDSIYSVDGAVAPIAELYGAAQDFGATLIVDEAHALGVRGPGGRGIVAEQDLAGAPDLVVTTVLSKSLGAQGGAVLGSALLRDHLIDRARTFIFDTGLAPAAVGAARAALRILRAEPERVDRTRAAARTIAQLLGAPEPEAAVVSLIVGDPDRAVRAAQLCRERGVLVGCFRPPSVPVGTSRLRLTVRADLTDDEIATAANHIDAALREVGAR
ncbi:8-amino-7-oxononanoate synthase [Jongsikchunia kroppenstedtii]|uniref:8-amino-7-oxononanoate synthase n=1 Tax=Jongsikchunia kroppenstedtii TaxID=1121721 RepID=UPI0005B9D6C4|nr:8-amino-7-oxononanoate synthase [Jongsikchunia kroppenstedtii]